MRLGLIGPCHGNFTALRSRAELLLGQLRVDRAVYLGVDSALDSVVSSWAREIVAADPSDSALWARAADACATASHQVIDAFIEKERRRSRLQLIECLPHAKARCIELFESVVSVLIYDKAHLDEEDILPATILVFGKSRDPIIHRVGSRIFVSPGPADHPAGGAAILADEDDKVVVTVFAPDGKLVRRETAAQRAANVRVSVRGAR